MNDENKVGGRMESGSSGNTGLLARIRTRTEREQAPSSSATAAPYSAAALGQTPYVAMGNGVVIVQRKCNWNC